MIVNDITTFKKHIPTVATAPFEKLKPHVVMANERIKNDVLGHELYNRADIFDDDLKALCERFVCLRAYERAIPFLDLKQTEQGFAVIDTAGFMPASKDRVLALVKATKIDGDDAEDCLLSFLETLTGELKNLWLESDVCTYVTDTYISTFRVFQRYCPIVVAKKPANRREFAELRGELRTAIQFKIVPAISYELNSVLLKQIRENNVSYDNGIILEPLRFAIVSYAIGLPNKCDEYLRQVLNIMKINPDKYPLWKTSAVGQAELNRIEPENDGPIFFGGF